MRRLRSLLVGEPRELGIDQEVGAGQVERQRHAVGPGLEASLGGATVGRSRFYGANDPRRGTGLAAGY